jgi:hypothetical protein
MVHPARATRSLLLLLPGAVMLTFGAFSFLPDHAAEAAGITYYVSNTTAGCSDSGAGTSQTAPWCNVTRVNSATFQPGDQILFKRGDTWNAQALKPPSSGTSAAPITFGAYGTGNKPKFDGNNSATSDHYWAGLVQLRNGQSYIVVQDLELYNNQRDIITILATGGSVHHITLQNLTVHKNNVAGYRNIMLDAGCVQGSVTNVVIQNNTVNDSLWNGIRATGGVTYLTIQDNTFSGNVHDDIDIGVQNDSPYNDHLSILRNTLNGSTNGACMYLTAISNSLIDQNVIRNCVTGPGGGGSGIKMQPQVST